MTRDIVNRLTRIGIYFARLRRDITSEDCLEALANCAELHYQADKLWHEIEKFYSKRPTQTPN